MMGLVETVRKRVSPECLVEECDKDNCSVLLEGAPEQRLIIDFDEEGSPLAREQMHCDYLLIADVSGKPSWVVPLEFKSGSSSNKIGRVVTKAVKQLHAGACAAEQLVPNDETVNFLPVAVFSICKFQKIKLRSRNNRVLFCGSGKAVRLLTCGKPLNKVLRP